MRSACAALILLAASILGGCGGGGAEPQRVTGFSEAQGGDDGRPVAALRAALPGPAIVLQAPQAVDVTITLQLRQTVAAPIRIDIALQLAGQAVPQVTRRSVDVAPGVAALDVEHRAVLLLPAGQTDLVADLLILASANGKPAAALGRMTMTAQWLVAVPSE